tara:strand:+ start:290 stop:757 length:468 start_codon:yes stop_codon:yes gene_type:complete
MNREEFKEKIKVIIRGVYKIADPEVEPLATDHYLMQKFPSLREVIVNLLTDQYNDFVEDIEWVAPRPTTFRVVLKNGESFYLIYTGKSYIATVEGKKYYLLNIGEDERAAQAIARLLRRGKFGKGGEAVEGGEVEAIETETETETEEAPPEPEPV